VEELPATGLRERQEMFGIGKTACDRADHRRAERASSVADKGERQDSRRQLEPLVVRVLVRDRILEQVKSHT